MDTTTLLAVIGILGGLGSALFTLIASLKTTKVADRKVDAEAYDRAQRMYAAALDDFEKQLRRLRIENQELIEVNQRLQKQLSQLEVLVVRLRRQMMDRGMTPENGTFGDP